MTTEKQLNEELELLQATVRLSGKLLGVVLGLIMGLGVFLATNWLVLKGGPVDEATGQEIVGLDDDSRCQSALAVAPGVDDGHLIAQPRFGQLRPEGFGQIHGPHGSTARHAQEDSSPVGRVGRLGLLPEHLEALGTVEGLLSHGRITHTGPELS